MESVHIVKLRRKHVHKYNVHMSKCQKKSSDLSTDLANGKVTAVCTLAQLFTTPGLLYVKWIYRVQFSLRQLMTRIQHNGKGNIHIDPSGHSLTRSVLYCASVYVGWCCLMLIYYLMVTGTMS